MRLTYLALTLLVSSTAFADEVRDHRSEPPPAAERDHRNDGNVTVVEYHHRGPHPLGVAVAAAGRHRCRHRRVRRADVDADRSRYEHVERRRLWRRIPRGRSHARAQ